MREKDGRNTLITVIESNGGDKTFHRKYELHVHGLSATSFFIYEISANNARDSPFSQSDKHHNGIVILGFY